MIVLLSMFIILLLYFCMRNNDNKKKVFIISLLIVFSLFAFRNIVGVDDTNYKLYFDLIKNNEIKKFFDISGVEYSFYIIARFLAFFNLNYKSLFFVYSLFSFYFLHKIIKEMNLDYYESLIFIISFLAFCTVPYITIMRQFLASMIGIYAILRRKDIIVSILLIIFAVCIHFTSLIFVPLLFFDKYKKFLSWKVYCIFPVFCYFLNITGISKILFKLIFGLTGYSRYVLEIDSSFKTGSGITVIFMFLIYLFTIYMFRNTQDRKYDDYFFFSFIFFSLYFVTKNCGVISRLYDYFIMFQSFPLVFLLCKLKKKIKNYGTIALILFLSFLVFYNFRPNSSEQSNFNRFSFKNYSLNFWR